jgi:hypothetical protein
VGFFAYVERDPALQQVERLVFAAVDVRVRPNAGRLGREELEAMPKGTFVTR